MNTARSHLAIKGFNNLPKERKSSDYYVQFKKVIMFINSNFKKQKTIFSE